MSRRNAERKDKGDMSQFEKFVTDGNEKADGLAKAGAMLYEGSMAETRAKTAQQEREEVYAALQYAASFHCLVEEWKDCDELKPKPKEKWNFVVEERQEARHQTEWFVEADKYRSHEIWKRQHMDENEQNMHMAKVLDKNWGKWRERHLGGHGLVDRQGEVLF